MKKIIRPVIILIVSIVLALISAAFTNTGSHQPSKFAEYSNAAFVYQTTATPLPAQDHSEVGSTDGLTLMSFVIVAIIVIPIVLKRKDWSLP
jgi:hypothetical protein